MPEKKKSFLRGSLSLKPLYRVRAFGLSIAMIGLRGYNTQKIKRGEIWRFGECSVRVFAERVIRKMGLGTSGVGERGTIGMRCQVGEGGGVWRKVLCEVKSMRE